MPTFVEGLILALKHRLAGRLRMLSSMPRSRWLSIAGGASLAYVFLHLLPDLAEHQPSMRSAATIVGAAGRMLAGS